MAHLSKNSIQIVLEETNPGLTVQELEELTNALYAAIQDDGKTSVDIDLLERSHQATQKLKQVYSNIEPQTTDDVILVNDLNTLEFQLSEAINNFR